MLYSQAYDIAIARPAHLQGVQQTAQPSPLPRLVYLFLRRLIFLTSLRYYKYYRALSFRIYTLYQRFHARNTDRYVKFFNPTAVTIFHDNWLIAQEMPKTKW